MNSSWNALFAVAAFGLTCQSPDALAAYSSASADAVLTVFAGSDYELFSVNVPPSTSRATVGDALASAEGGATALDAGLLLTGSVSSDALFPPASAASAGFGSVQPLFIFNTSGAANPLQFSLDWRFVVSALEDLVAPSEVATSTLTIRLQQVVGDVTLELFSTSALATIFSGESSDAGSFAYAYELAPNAFTTFLVSIDASSFAATAVPLPAPALLMAPALGMLVLRRRVAR
ncbi:MAG: hypothetical protein AB7I01_06940 [Gammaproteobacteria bacterium]